MSWTDYKSIEQMKKLRDLYKIKIFVETGTFRGVNAEVHAKNFEDVITCEVDTNFYKIANERLQKYDNVHNILFTSDGFLNTLKRRKFPEEMIFIYLDAHFYDPKLPPEEKWVVLNELKALQNTTDCVIAIHDFDNHELGHLVYDGEHLNFDLLKEHLHNVNPNFHYYTNTKAGCDIVTLEKMKEYYPHVEIDDNIIDTLNFVWSNEIKTYRGILYCTPTELDLNNFELVKVLS